MARNSLHEKYLTPLVKEHTLVDRYNKNIDELIKLRAKISKELTQLNAMKETWDYRKEILRVARLNLHKPNSRYTQKGIDEDVAFLTDLKIKYHKRKAEIADDKEKENALMAKLEDIIDKLDDVRISAYY